MKAKSMLTREAFYSQLEALQKRFDSMEPELEVSVRDKSLDVEGHIVVWNTAISREGPLPNCAKGGTRIRPGLDLEEVKMLARNMAIKNAAAGLPLGGCKSGLNGNPKSENFEKKYRRFIELCKPFTYENGGIFGGFGFDIGASPEHAIWACDTLKSTRSFTGKPIDMGGTDYDREGIAGLGVAEAAAEILSIHQHNICDIRFSVHGAGAMGAAVIRYFGDMGANLASIGDPKYGGTWSFSGPISIQLYLALIGQKTEKVMELLEQEGEKISSDANDVLFCTTDVLFPCALQHVITSGNVNRLHTRYIVEGANNPTCLDANEKLFQRGIHQIPDFIANAGGVIAAFVEMTTQVSDEENLRTRIKTNEAKEMTKSTIKKNVGRIVELADNLKIPLRDAGLFVALNAVLENEACS